ncbi:serine/threonine-protein kinase [Hyalangium versicolor]|uniref:serine/threonine-protein kinase n=1 Tax=Hyalangium versicolor TaxID=2861190 RepID=UPI001CCBFAF1|nr:serine/threonine-protein kinase [Hyalangium versicolor]
MSLQPGEQFGRYELVSWLGRGGMAETYRARLVAEAGVTKPVLIKKVLPEFINDEAFIAMFISEARISATLSHGNIAQVYDFGRVEGDYFLAMEFVEGQPLHRILKRAHKSGMSTIPIPLAAFIAMEMCRGLHYAHTRTDEKGQPLGIVHRDISPDNVLISYEGQVKIVDFGIAKARELRGFSTEPGIVKGKYLFFSPEQAQGEEVDARTDVWATGIVLYEMLCGKLPVEDDAPEVAMDRLISGSFPRLRERNPSVPAELDAIVMEALALNKEERYASCHAFGDALAGFLAATAPRFSAVSLSHFVQELFREDITSTGRQVQVPPTFPEQLAQWRGQSPTAILAPPGRPQPQPPTDPDPERSPAKDVETRIMPPRKGMSVGAVVGLVLLVGAILGGGFLVWKGMRPKVVGDPSNPQPLQLTEAPLAPPPSPPAERLAEATPPPEEEAPATEETPEPATAPAQEPPPTSAAPTNEPAPSLSAEEQEAQAAYDSAIQLLEKKQFAPAEQRAQRCIQLTPENAECHRVAAEASSGRGQFDKAVGYYRRFLELAPDHELAPQIRKSVASYEQRKRRRTPSQ